MKGIIIKAISGFYYVEAGNQLYECKARGIFRKDKISPLVGDRVEISVTGSKGIVESIEHRKNQLLRPPLANLDKLFIVSAFSTPAPNPLIIDRLISIAEHKGIEPVIVFNKSDLGSFDEFRTVYVNAGFKTFVVSCENGEGFNDMLSCFDGCISAITGNSGVGKSSILNYLIPSLSIETGEVSMKLGRGRHTTRQVELYPVSNGYIADTPGFSSIDFERCEVIMKEELPDTFREFKPYLGDCQFTSCSHTTEKGRAILEAVGNGEISHSRHNSYCTIYNEIKGLKSWELSKK